MRVYITISLSIVFLVSSPFMLSLQRPRKRPVCDPENRYAYITTTISASVLDFGSIDILLTQPEREPFVVMDS